MSIEKQYADLRSLIPAFYNFVVGLLLGKGKIKGWEFGDGVRVACCNVNGRYFAIQGQCPRCAFDLWKGDLIVNDSAWDDLPRVACPTCATTFSMRSGKHGPPIKRAGLQAFVSGLAKSATVNEASKDAKAFMITVDDQDGKVYCR
jgi:nitrite reductase/ring-hydroxylating ferredoxin subunit